MLWSQASLESYWNEELLNWESAVNCWSVGGHCLPRTFSSLIVLINFKEPKLFLFLQSPLGGFAPTHTLVHTYYHTPAPPAPYVMATLEALVHYSVFSYLMKCFFFLSGTRTSGKSLVSLSLSCPTGRIYTLILQRPAATGWNSPCPSSSSSLPTMLWTNMDM